MDYAELQKLLKNFSDLSITKMNLEWGDFKLQLEKEPCSVSFEEKTAASSPTSKSETVSENQQTQGVAVKSPVVGVFYAASAPGAAPYVTVGQHVEKGQTLCIVEAMKMMNEISAPVSGTVTSILAQQEGAVEYGQTILFIDADR